MALVGWLALPAVVPAGVEPVLKASSLTAVAGEPIRLTLKLPTGESWADAHIGRAVIRTHGRQDQINTKPVGDADYVEVTVPKPGLALIIVDVGPASQKARKDAWPRTTHCTKLVVRVAPKEGGPKPSWRTSNPGITAKAGNELEVLPYIDPSTLRPGDDLPVRVYYEGAKQPGETVTAYGPKGAKVTAVSDSVGIATLMDIPTAGRWVVRYEKTRNGMDYVADLVFDLAAPKATADGKAQKGAGK